MLTAPAPAVTASRNSSGDSSPVLGDVVYTVPFPSVCVPAEYTVPGTAVAVYERFGPDDGAWLGEAAGVFLGALSLLLLLTGGLGCCHSRII